MHIHGNSMSLNAIDAYSAAQGAKAAAAERAAEVRKKLLKSAFRIEGASEEETLMIGRWLDARPTLVGNGEQDHVSATGRDCDFG